jgi:hypothetical protein
MPRTAFLQRSNINKEVSVFVEKGFFANAALIDVMGEAGHDTAAKSGHGDTFWQGNPKGGFILV